MLTIGTSLLEGANGDGWLLGLRASLQLEGLPFATLARALREAPSSPSVSALERSLRTRGLEADDAKALVAQLGAHGLLARSRGPGREWWSAAKLEKLLRERAPELRVRVGPWRVLDVERPPALALRVGPEGFWVGPLGEGCLECAALESLSSQARELLPLASAPAGRAEIVLGRAEVARLRAAVERVVRERRRPGAARRWLTGPLSASRMRVRTVPAAFGCSSCRWEVPSPTAKRAWSLEPFAPKRRPGGGEIMDWAAATRAVEAVWQGLGIPDAERRVAGKAARGFRPPPIVCVDWRLRYRLYRGAPFEAWDSNSAGSCFTLPERRFTGRMEGLEHLCGYFRRADVARTPLRSLRHPALPIADWALYSEAQYRQPGFPFRRPTPATVLDWVWATDLHSGERLLLPRPLVAGPPVVGELTQTTGNGWSAHRTLEHARICGILEAIERHALQIAWYGGPGGRIVDPESLGLPEARRTNQRWVADVHWKVHLVSIPNAGAAYVFVAIAELARDAPPLRPGAATLGFGASMSARRAAEHALSEMIASLQGNTRLLPPFAREALGRPPDLAKMWVIPNNRNIIYAYLDAAMRPLLDCFLQGPPLRGPWREGTDDLASLLADLKALGRRALSVDLTQPRMAPLSAAVTFVTGIQPLGYGAGAQRLATGLLPAKPAVRGPPLPAQRIDREPGRVFPYPLPLA